MKSAIPSSSAVPRRRCRRRSARRARRLRPAPARRAVRLRRQLPGAIDPELAHVRALPVTLIAASWLSQCIIGAGHVEYVVDDLEEHAQLGGEAAERRCLRIRLRSPTTVVRTAPTRRSDVRSSARAGGAARARPAGASALDVGVLAADHPVDAGRRRQLGGRRQHALAAASAGGSAGGGRPPRRARRRRGSRRPRRTSRDRSAARGAGRRRPSPAGRRGSASRCGSARSPPASGSTSALLAGRPRGRSRARAPAGCACRRRAASSASPPPGPPSCARRRSASPPGSARPRSRRWSG